MRRLQVAVEAMMRGQEGAGPTLFRAAMTPFAFGYGIAVKLRNLYYDVRGGQKVSIPVISVGNLIAGGTGKTDVVTWLAEKLPGKVAIVSRGYGVKIKKPFVVREEHGAECCGDEPRMLANRLPGCLVIVGPDRVRGAELAAREGAELIVLDDGMQHRRLHRDLEVIVEGEGTHFLPKGLLRDDPKRLRKADLLLSPAHLQSQIEGIFSLDGEKVETLRGVKVALFCGIGNPSRFVKTVEELGAEIRETLFLADHEKACEEELALLLKRSGANYLVCTEKDQVKLKSDLPILWVKRRLLVDENAVSWQNALAKVRKMLK